MNTLAKTLSAAVVAGSLIGGTALAQDTTVELTDEQQFAVDLVMEFNTCVQNGYAAIATYEEQAAPILEQFIEDNSEVIDSYNAASRAWWNAPGGSTAEAEAAAIMADLEPQMNALEAEVDALITAQLGEEPADPDAACFEASEQTLADNGTDYDSTIAVLEGVYQQYGEDVYNELTTPAAPAPGQ